MRKINNEFYKDLGEKWYSSEGEAVALLRIEKRTVNPWVIQQIDNNFPGRADLKVLDIGCGGGFLTLDLADRGWKTTGVDVSESILDVGRKRDPQKRVNWVNGTAENLPVPDRHFDVVCMMDVLEHVHEPRVAIKEVARVIKPGGIFIFHTFNRTLRAWLFAAKGLDWFIKDSIKHVHDWRMFIKPRELKMWMREVGLEPQRMEGIHPRVFSLPFFQLLVSRRVPDNFSFRVGGGLGIGYLGYAKLL